MSEINKIPGRCFSANWMVLLVGIVLLAMVVWWPSSPSVPNGSKISTYPDINTPPVTLSENSVKDEHRGRQLIQTLRWIPGGFPLAVAVDLGAARRYSWTKIFSVLFNNPSFRRHLDVLELDADGFEWLGIGAMPDVSPVYWNGKNLQFVFVPHVFFLRGREGRMQILRRFWQSGRNKNNLQVGQYQLVFPLKREPHLVIGAWKADTRAPLNIVEENRTLQSFCTLQQCDKHISEINAWAHFVGAYAPAVPMRLGPKIGVRMVWIVGEWNMDGLLLHARVLLTGNCAQARTVFMSLFSRTGALLRIDAGILQRLHAVCNHDDVLHFSLPLTVAEIHKQWVILGFPQHP